MARNIWLRSEHRHARRFFALLMIVSLASISIASACTCVQVDQSDSTATDRDYDLVFVGILRDVRSDKQPLLNKLSGSTNGKILIFDVRQTIKGQAASHQTVVDLSEYNTSCSLQHVPDLSLMVGRLLRVSASKNNAHGSDPDTPAYAIQFSLCSSPLVALPSSRE